MAQRLELKGLDNLLKAVKDTSKPIIRVGILGSNAEAVHKPEGGKSEGSSNLPTVSQVGAAHEYGTVHLPVRSFLRVPLSTNLGKAMNSSGALTKDTMQEVLKRGTVEPWLWKIAFIAEQVVLESFATGGDGTWKPSDMTRKNNPQTLVEEQQLLRSITAEVKKNG